MSQPTNSPKYGLNGLLTAQEGKGNELAQLLLQAAELMQHAKGCHLYLVHQAAENPSQVYVTEVWDSKADHDASLQLPGVAPLIQQAMPLMAGKPEGTTLVTLGGKGL